MGFSLRPKSKDQSKALNSEVVEKKPLYVHYDKEGNLIGDDGFLMTKKRKRMHRVFNAMFIWCIISALFAIFCAIFAFAQGQQWSSVDAEHYLDIVVQGGNMYNEYEVGTLLRLEGLLGLFSAVVFGVLHIQGFHWFYDGRSLVMPAVLMGGIAVFSIAFEVVAVGIVRIIDPVATINLVLLVITVICMRQVVNERPTLKKAKVAKTVEK
jgi:hypothetical protein